MSTALTLDELATLAARIWADTAAGDVVWLSGDLGSGKTTFAQLLCAAAGARDVNSPTYALVQEYDTDQGAIVHADCYRLMEPGDARDLDLLVRARDARLTLIEWPERGGSLVPASDIHLQFAHHPEPHLRLLRGYP